VREALDNARRRHQDRHEQMRDEFAAALADRLNIPESKVKEALEALPHPGPHPGPPHGP
jgi:hypothetical protein